MKKGDIVLIPFPFTDLSGNKLRPALVLISGEDDVTVSFITTQMQWLHEADVLLKPLAQTGLKKESLIRLSKLATIDNDLVVGRIGEVDNNILSLINANLRKILKLED